jgi:myosin heavy subunit
MTNNSEPPLSQEQVPPATESNESIESQHRQVNSSHVYIKDKTHGWLPGVLVNTNEKEGIATVICKRKENFNKQEVKVNLGEYGPSKSLPLQCVNSQGSTVFVEDLRDLAYSNEASILYNLKERYDEQRTPYTRATNNVMVAINPYKWIDGLYAERIRTAYAENIVWKGTITIVDISNITSLCKSLQDDF